MFPMVLSAGTFLKTVTRPAIMAVLVAGISATLAAYWHPIPVSEPESIQAMAASDSALVIAKGWDLIRSTDGGATWATSDKGMEESRNWIVSALARSSSGLVASRNKIPYHSSDGGLTWTRAFGGTFDATGFESKGDSLLALTAPAPKVPGTISKLYSLDGGLTWKTSGQWDWAPGRSDPVPVGPDTQYMLNQGRLERSSDGGNRWERVADVTLDTSESFLDLGRQGRRLFLRTPRGVIWEFSGPGTGRMFSPFLSKYPNLLGAVGEGSNLCVTSDLGLSCSWDDGEHWTFLRSNIGNRPPLAMGSGYLYLLPYGLATHSDSSTDIERFDMRARAWKRVAWPRKYNLQNFLFAVNGSRVMAYSMYGSLTSGMVSRDNGDTWDTLPGKSRGPVGGPSSLFMSKDWWGVSWNVINATKDDGLHWIFLPQNPGQDPFAFPRADKAASGSRVYVPRDSGGIWVGDFEHKSWSILEGDSATHFNRVSASDSALYLIAAGLFRVDLRGGTVSVPPVGNRAVYGHRVRLGMADSGPRKLLAIPAHGNSARPRAYDCTGALSSHAPE
jgi:photosystem II stability/assembly factor-like uncharacterized protein